MLGFSELLLLRLSFFPYIFTSASFKEEGQGEKKEGRVKALLEFEDSRVLSFFLFEDV